MITLAANVWKIDEESATQRLRALRRDAMPLQRAVRDRRAAGAAKMRAAWAACVGRVGKVGYPQPLINKFGVQDREGLFAAIAGRREVRAINHTAGERVGETEDRLVMVYEDAPGRPAGVLLSLDDGWRRVPATDMASRHGIAFAAAATATQHEDTGFVIPDASFVLWLQCRRQATQSPVAPVVCPTCGPDEPGVTSWLPWRRVVFWHHDLLIAAAHARHADGLVSHRQIPSGRPLRSWAGAQSSRWLRMLGGAAIPWRVSLARSLAEVPEGRQRAALERVGIDPLTLVGELRDPDDRGLMVMLEPLLDEERRVVVADQSLFERDDTWRSGGGHLIANFAPRVRHLLRAPGHPPTYSVEIRHAGARHTFQAPAGDLTGKLLSWCQTRLQEVGVAAAWYIPEWNAKAFQYALAMRPPTALDAAGRPGWDSSRGRLVLADYELGLDGPQEAPALFNRDAVGWRLPWPRLPAPPTIALLGSGDAAGAAWGAIYAAATVMLSEAADRRTPGTAVLAYDADAATAMLRSLGIDGTICDEVQFASLGTRPEWQLLRLGRRAALSGELVGAAAEVLAAWLDDAARRGFPLRGPGPLTRRIIADMRGWWASLEGDSAAPRSGARRLADSGRDPAVWWVRLLRALRDAGWLTLSTTGRALPDTAAVRLDGVDYLSIDTAWLSATVRKAGAALPDLREVEAALEVANLLRGTDREEEWLVRADFIAKELRDARGNQRAS